MQQERVRATGDVQSPPSASAAYAQAGICTVGQLANRRNSNNDNYHNLQGLDCLARLDPLLHQTNSVGAITYKVVDSLHGYDLKDPREMSRFAIVLVATLKETMETTTEPTSLVRPARSHSDSKASS